MFSLKHSSTARSAALALAIAVSVGSVPAFAETPFIDVIPSKPTIHRDIGPLPAPKPPASTVTFKPDVRVNSIGKTDSGGGNVTYRFRVQNVGAASAAGIGLETRIYQRSLPTVPATESVATMQNGNGGSIASLGQDEAREIAIVCTPLPGYRCDGARLNAIVSDDLDPSNNMAVGE